jgi:hypothetical protein
MSCRPTSNTQETIDNSQHFYVRGSLYDLIYCTSEEQRHDLKVDHLKTMRAGREGDTAVRTGDLWPAPDSRVRALWFTPPLAWRGEGRHLGDVAGASSDTAANVLWRYAVVRGAFKDAVSTAKVVKRQQIERMFIFRGKENFTSWFFKK